MPRMMKITINSQTTGSFRTEKIDGVDHIVTNMMPIVGDSVMNGILYPDVEVTAAFNQLDNIQAPYGHPVIDGQHVSASTPRAINAFNVGGFVRKPAKTGKNVSCEFCLNVETANKSDKGKELLTRMQNSELIEVSTGLKLKHTTQDGTTPDGMVYNSVGSNFIFDHVAVLPADEPAAGTHVGTVLTVNGEKWTLNQLSADSLRSQLRSLLNDESKDVYVYQVDFFPEEKQVIYEVEPRKNNVMFKSALFKRGYAIDANEIVSLLNDTKEVIKKVDYVEKGVITVNYMENVTMANKQADKEKPNGEAPNGEEGGGDPVTTNTEQSEGLTAAIETVKAAGLTVNSAKQQDDDTDFIKTNKAAIERFVNAETAKIKGLREDLIKDAGMTESVVNSLDDNTVVNLADDLLKPKTVNNSLRAGSGVDHDAGDHFAKDGQYGQITTNRKKESD